MKTKLKFVVILLVCFSLLTIIISSCNKRALCDRAKTASDLIIPELVKLYKQNGQPWLDNYGNQILGENTIFFNKRTGEYFNKQTPPQLGVLVGDVIQMGTNVFNEWLDQECELGADAGESKTAPKLTVQLNSGQSGVQNLASMYTPPIQKNDRQFTFTEFQFYGPGNYNVDFNANSTKSVEEHSYDNNYYSGQDRTYLLQKNDFWLKVETLVEVDFTELPINEYAKTTREVGDKKNEDFELYNFVKSGEFDKWILNQK